MGAALLRPCPFDHSPFRPRVLAARRLQQQSKFSPSHIETRPHLPYYSPTDGAAHENPSRNRARSRPTTARAASVTHPASTESPKSWPS